MQLIVGLGNPGDKYKENRHNAGFMVVDVLSAKICGSELSFDNQKKFDSDVKKYKNIIFVKPQSFMNSSGQAVKKLVEFYKINVSNVWVVHDDLDIKLGQYKIQKGVGPKLHNGVESIERSLGKRSFWRVRVGVDNRNTDNRISGEDYVLKDFSEEEKSVLEKVIEKICDDIKSYLSI